MLEHLRAHYGSVSSNSASTSADTIIITERSLHTDRMVFAKMLYESGLIEDVNYQIYLKWFDGSQIPDEHAYITYLLSKGLETELILTNNLASGATTFILWNDMDYKYKDLTKNNNPRYYEEISDEEIEYLFNAPCFFGRKFKKDFKNSDNIMANGFLLGCHQGMIIDDVDYICNILNSFSFINFILSNN